MSLNSRSILRAKKTNVVFYDWSGEKLKTKDFPLVSRFGLSKRFRWKIITFKALDRSFRALGAYHTLVPEYLSILAEDIHPYNRIFLRKEFHQSHAGWHVHGQCYDIDKVTTGVVNTLGQVRIPKSNSFHRRELLINNSAVMDDKIAEAILCRNFNIPYENEDLFVSDALPWN